MLRDSKLKNQNHDRQKITLPRIRTRCSCVLRVPERALDIGPPQRLSGLHRLRHRSRFRCSGHLLPPRQHPADRRRRQDGILERRQCAGDRQYGRQPHERRRLHPHRGQGFGQRRPAIELRAESDLFRGLRLSLLVVVLPLLLDARILGRLAGMALSLPRILRLYGRFAADRDAGSGSRPAERQETARHLGQLHRRPAHLVGKPQPAAHAARPWAAASPTKPRAGA